MRLRFQSLFVALAFVSGCHMCNDIRCFVPFSLLARGSEPTLAPGLYVLDLELDESVYSIDCVVPTVAAPMNCGEPRRTAGDQDFEIDASVVYGPESDPRMGLSIGVTDTSGSETEGRVTNCRGPNHVRLAVFHADTQIGVFEEELEYERDDDYRGEGCGFSDRLQYREFVLDDVVVEQR